MATPRSRHARGDDLGQSCASLQKKKMDNVCPITMSPAKKKTARPTLEMQHTPARAELVRSDSLRSGVSSCLPLPRHQ